VLEHCSTPNGSPIPRLVSRGSVVIPLRRLAINEEIDRWFEVQPPVVERQVPGQIRLVILLQGPHRRALHWLLLLYASLLAWFAAIFEAYIAAMALTNIHWALSPLAICVVGPALIGARVLRLRVNETAEHEIVRNIHVGVVTILRPFTDRLMRKAVGQQVCFEVCA
jgi:hypothetical protein